MSSRVQLRFARELHRSLLELERSCERADVEAVVPTLRHEAAAERELPFLHIRFRRRGLEVDRTTQLHAGLSGPNPHVRPHRHLHIPDREALERR